MSDTHLTTSPLQYFTAFLSCLVHSPQQTLTFWLLPTSSTCLESLSSPELARVLLSWPGSLHPEWQSPHFPPQASPSPVPCQDLPARWAFSTPAALISSSLSHCPKRVQVSPLPLYVLFVTAGYCLPHQACRVRITRVYPQLSPHTRQVDLRISSTFRILGESR